MQLCVVYAQLQKLDAEQIAPHWQPISELPLCIDRTGGIGTTLKCLLTDEHVIIPN